MSIVNFKAVRDTTVNGMSLTKGELARVKTDAGDGTLDGVPVYAVANVGSFVERAYLRNVDLAAVVAEGYEE